MQEISNMIGENQYATLKVTCMDCNENFELYLKRISSDKIKIINGVIGKLKGVYSFKCENCWKKDKNFGTPTEVYSRVVGYIRPTNYWNQGKREEFKMRKPYKETFR